jgi:hypothetical protein
VISLSTWFSFEYSESARINISPMAVSGDIL